MPDLRVCFAGTPEFAATHLSALLDNQQNVVCVYTQPDRPSGRGKRLQASPVKSIALDNNIEVRQPPSLKNESAQQDLRELNIDLLIVVAYGLILPKEILAIPRLGCINVHASLLPLWRGAAPIERSLLAGDKETGVTIMLMDEGLDTGPMLHKESVAIEDSENREELTNKLAIAGTKALLYTLENLQALLSTAKEQDDSMSSYAAKIDKAEAIIDWQKSASHINRLVRVGVGRAPAYSLLNGERVRILEAESIPTEEKVIPGTILRVDKAGIDVGCKGSILRVSKLQLPGKKPWTAADLVNSRNSMLVSGKLFDANTVV